MPKGKKKGKGSRGDKEKPLLTVQGVLRLDKCFVTARHEDAPTVQVRKDDSSDLETLKLVPGQSEHDMVQYKAGYDTGPQNPFPQNEHEAKVFAEQRKIDERVEAFEEMKEQSERERREREERFKQQQTVPHSNTTSSSAPVQEKLNPDDPSSYLKPPPDLPSNFHHPKQFPKEVKPPGEEDVDQEGKKEMQLETGQTTPEDSNQGEEVQEFEEAALPTMKSMPQWKPISNSDNGESQSGKNIGEMALEVAKEMEEKRKQEARERIIERNENDQDLDDMMYSLDELSKMKEASLAVQGPEMTEQSIQEVVKSQQDQNAKAVLEAYWKFVKDNPQDFSGWCYLVEHVENVDDLSQVRKVYNAFLPLFPYCFAYWQRYSNVEKKHENWQRALAILHRGLEAIPLSVDLWISYLELYKLMYQKHESFGDLFRTQCERAIQTVGLEYNSDPLWERYVEWELETNNLKNVTGIFKRLVAIPTRLYNKHWDNFIAHIRDHHPRDILDYDEYEELRKITCQELELTYRPDPAIEPVQPREVVQPEDKLKAGMKERIVASVIGDHERCEAGVDKRFKFEEKIKRSYFHVKPLDLKQLKNWEAYLDFEMAEGNHERVVVLFERCLIACALYEQFWAKYARYLEQHFKGQGSESRDKSVQKGETESPLKRARFAFGTGLTNVDDIRDKRCTWTLRGWKEKDKDGNEVMVAEEVTPAEPTEKKPEQLPTTSDHEPESSSVQDIDDTQHDIDDEMSTVTVSATDSTGIASVRDVYQRACIVHCQKKAMIKLRWAAFEEEHGDYDKAKEVLEGLEKQFPLLLEACIQLIDMERRGKNLDRVEELYKILLGKIPQNRKKVQTWVALKLARFQFKVSGKPDRALATLRAALKRDRSDPRIYSQIVDICYQRQPVDVKGVTAAIELVLKSNELKNMDKLEFVKRKVEFMQEFGDVKQYRDARDQIKKFRQKCAADLKLAAKRKKELEQEEERLRELEAFRAQVRADVNMKAKVAEAEGMLMCTNCQAQMYPDADGRYEFERGYARPQATAKDKGPADTVEDADGEDGVVDLMELEIPEEQEEQIKVALMEKTKYKEVAPTWELNMETYGYGKKRKTYDPDYEHVETAKFKEYERLETTGYDESIKDADHDKLKNISAPGLGSSQAAATSSGKKLYTLGDYVVPPKVPQLQLGPAIGPRRPTEDAPGSAQDLSVFELPPEIANPQQSPCVNVPEWFVKEGGELCLSDTANGVSVLRYWPKFLSEKGNSLMFSRLRKYCKWHQKQVKIGGEWKCETRLVAWYGPCDYSYSGLHLDKNLNWAPELLDLLHRLNAITRHEFNSVFCNLYRHGHDMCGWHADVHPQLGRNPPVASVSLGVVRVFELRKKTGAPNFIRFPLFPGSLLVMEGATQEDWLHCLPRDVNCKEERINLTFRTMYSIDKR